MWNLQQRTSAVPQFIPNTTAYTPWQGTPLRSAVPLPQHQFTHKVCKSEPLPLLLPQHHFTHRACKSEIEVSAEAPKDVSSSDPFHDLSDTMLEPWLEPHVKQARRQALGLDGCPKKAEFLAKCEFVSLGNFCGVARALQAIDVKKKAYPFDWVRSPVEGVIRSFETDFEDFLTFSMERDDEPSKLHVFTESRWGGAFWHHDPRDPKTRDDFTRRIERLIGVGDVEASQPRVFVRAVNSTSEIDMTTQLYRTLQRALPEAKVYLLVLIDFQLAEGPFRLAGDHDTSINILFYKINEKAFATQPWSMQRVCDAYSEAIAFAVDVWAGDGRALESTSTVKSLTALNALCDQFAGGSPGSEGFWPRRFQGQQIRVSRRTLPDQLPGLLAPAGAVSAVMAAQSLSHSTSPLPMRLSSAPSLPARERTKEQIFDLRIPDGVAPGNRFDAKAFGGTVNVEVPAGAVAGQLLRLKLMEGVVSLVLCMSATTAHAATCEAVAMAMQVGDVKASPESLR